ncbi:MAG: glycyl-radical enzyme activating protein [Vallitaleaceae bacterium]|nr:glycyl-radical enzyme activating protein [Vallitaleaceae bacterium]
MSKTLAIMEIERFAIHDGPGIRTTVFLQGCPLRCKWCANPESQEIGTKLLYLSNKCNGCGDCYRACAYGAITFEKGRPVFHREKCVQCRKCEVACLQNAIHFSGEVVAVDDIVEVVLKDQDYYQNSGGGVTISGGEAFVQFEGFLELLQKCKENNLHTAVETCGQYDVSKIKRAIPLLDLFLFDLKHSNAQKFYEYTGGNLEQILGNIQYIASIDPGKIILRVPVLPGFNFDETSINDIFNLALKFGIEKIHLLPYHTLGMSKYEQLGLSYDFEAQKSLLKEELIPYQKMGEDKGLKIQIGG